MKVKGCDLEITKTGDYVEIVIEQGDTRYEIELTLEATNNYGYELESNVEKWVSGEWISGVEDL